MAKPIDAETRKLMMEHLASPEKLPQVEVMRRLKLKHRSSFLLRFYRTMKQEYYKK